VPMAVNYPAPQLALQNINGRSESLADFRQNVLLVNNWATWCPPCKAEMPTLEEYYEAHSVQNFMLIAIEAGDAQDAVSQFARSHDLKFRVWLDPDNASLAVFRNENLPNSYVIDKTGTVRYAWTGAISRAVLEKYVTPLMTENN
jgi:cytochrome c biogenesis protein CcmG, thiol:disulfide interchange protein DsbE